MDIATLPALASTSSPLLPATVPAAPDALATARFNALMQQSPVPNAQAAATATSAGAPTTTATSPAVLSNSVGDRILHGMEGVSNNFQSAWKSVNATLDASAQSTSMQDMMRLQLQLVQVSVQYELVSKAVSRSTQNFDQLVRIQ
jgi:type III secretion protein I